MGYTNSKIRLLEITDPEITRDYRGEPLEIRMRPMRISDWRRLLKLDRLVHLPQEEWSEADAENALIILDIFAARLASWNLEDEDENDVRTPVPATLAGVESQELPFIMKLTQQWMDSDTALSAPLVQPSPGMPPFPVATLPMETLSRPPYSFERPA